MQASSNELLSKLIAFDTTSHLSNLPLIGFVEDYLASFGVSSTLVHDATGKKANLFATIGHETGGVCLHGHTDVVPVAGQPWNSDPFQLTAADGRLFGRGTADMKAWIACCLAALPLFQKRKLKTPIHLAFSYDEETGCLGAPSLIACFGISLPKPRLALVGEPSLMAPIVAHKGGISFDTTFTGREAHSSLAHLGVSAVTAGAVMTTVLHEISREWFEWPGPAEMKPSGPTLNVGKFAGGTARNIIARDAHLSWELRYRKQDNLEILLKQINERIESRLRDNFGAQYDVLKVSTVEHHRIPPFDAGISALPEVVARCCGVQGEARGVPYCAEAGQYAAAGVPTLICGPGSIEQAHRANEFIEQSQVHACDDFLAKLAHWAQENELPPAQGN